MPASASPPGSNKPARLGVNPRRSYVAEPERKRCKTACNLCNTRRIRCSGTKPCDQCTSAQRPCEYPVIEKKIYVPESSYKELRANKDVLELCLQRLCPDSALRHSLLKEARQDLATGSRAISVKEEEDAPSHSPTASISTAAMSPAQYQYYNYSRKSLGSMSTPATEGSLLQDHDGNQRWLGGTSGATFLDHLKKFMRTLKSSLGYPGSGPGTGSHFLASRGQYQTSDSRLLYKPVTDNGKFISTSDHRIVGPRLAKVDEYLQGAGGASACGGIYYFGDFSLNNWLTARTDHVRTPELAFYEIAFALGTIYSLTATNSRRDGQLGETYYANAHRIMGPLEEVPSYNMRHVPTLAMMAMYMLEMNRRDRAYYYLSNALSICAMCGLGKGSASERDHRITWTVFCLTREISCLMGRPPFLSVPAFQLPEPKYVPGLPLPDGLKANIELSKIADYIVSITYGTAPRESHNEDSEDQDPADQVGPPVRMLKEWRENLPDHLQIPFSPGDESYQVDGILADRPLFSLHMKWNQLLILALRPLFFLAVKSAIGADFLNNDWRDVWGREDKTQESYILECSAAARRNLSLGRHMNDLCIKGNNGQPSNGKLVMLDLHHIFNAAVILLLYQMVNLNIVNTDNFGITEARRVFEIEARTECLPVGVTGYASDCVSVLNDLAALVAQIRPLRFKDSDHVNTGINVPGSFGVGAPPPSFLDMMDGGYSTATFGSPMTLSSEQLAANLNLENPYGPDGLYDDLVGASEPIAEGLPAHTNRDEIQSWLQEENRYYCGPPLGGYTGV